MDQLSLSEVGLNTRARVTGSGQVDVDIARNTTGISNVLEKLLQKAHQHVTSTDQRIPIGEHEKESQIFSGATEALQLNIVIQVVGSRGDVQPFIALGKVLKDQHGHRIRLATHPCFKEFVENHGLEFFSIGGDPAELMAFMVKNPGLMPDSKSFKEGQIGQRRKDMAEILQRTWRSCFEKGKGEDGYTEAKQCRPFVADAIIANPPSFGHIHCAERLGVPLHMMFTMPWSPTQAFAHPLSNVRSSEVGAGLTNYLTYSLVELLTWQGLGDIVNTFREITLGLPPLTALTGPSLLNRLEIPYTYCWSPTLVPKPNDWGHGIDVAGFFFLNQSISYQPPEDLALFLSQGPPPVYIGFGSIVVDDPNALTSLIFQAVEKSGQRALVSKGWGGLGSDSFTRPSSTFLLGNVPHDWLFARVSCVVHHGGAGTTAAGIAAGKPTVVVPFFGDQPFWGSMTAKAGAGPEPIPYKDLTAAKLAEAILKALEPEVVVMAQRMAHSISEENGSESGAVSFQKKMDFEKLRCSLAPNLKAVWQLVNTQIRLSPLAASLLLKEGKVGMGQLRLNRAVEFKSSRHPTDPITGGASALVGSIGTFMGGVSDIPTEAFSHLKSVFSSKSSRPDNEKFIGEQETLQPSTISSDDLKPLDLKTGLDAGKGAAKAISAGLRSPADFTLALARGFRNLPRLYGDTTVREEPDVNDFKSGVKAATVGLGQGFFDGISGLLRHPSEGARKGGMEGFMKGVGKAIGGVVLKPAAGIWGVPGYLSEGFWQEIRTRISTRSDAEIVAARILEGEDALHASTSSEKQMILNNWIHSERLVPSPRPSATERRNVVDRVDIDSLRDDVHAAVFNNSRGNGEEDSLVSQATEAQILAIILDNDSAFYKETDSPSTIVSTSTSGFRDDESTMHTLEHSASQPHTVTNQNEDDPDIASDEDENIKAAITKSLGH